MKKFILALILLGTSILSFADIVTVPIPGAPGLSVTVGTGANALPLQNIQNNPNATNITTWDDNWTNVPLGFNFPYYGQTFNNSWAMTNGMVTFVDPMVSGIYGACCSGVDLTTTTDPRWNYSIFGVHSDLYSWNGQNQWYLRETDSMTYGWYNISQCCNSNGGNSFEIKITSTGTVDTRIAGALVNWNAVTSGMSGDLTKGEYYQFYHGSGINLQSGASWNTAGGFTGSDPCLTNPLSSTSCPGYALAYLNQQCSISALYDPSCPGYSAAYLSYQCSVNPLYSTSCSGYAQAYYTQQCSIDPLYDSGCQGYAQAYYTQQCSLNPLYDVGCDGYAVAYLEYQCSINPLYSTTCSGYQQAYFSQQCSMNGLYNRECPNYAEAYALTNVVNTTTTSTVTEPTQPIVVATNNNTSTPVAVVADPVVNSVVTTTSTTTSPAVAAPVVPLTTTTSTTTTTTFNTPVETKTESKSESKSEEKTDSSNKSSSDSKTESKSSSSSNTESKPSQSSTREQITAKRKEAAMQTAVKAGTEAAKELDSATSMASQVAVQNVVMSAMGYVPGFQAYSFIMPDGNGYKPFLIYKNQKNIDNRKMGMELYGPSDKLHNELTSSQYNREE